MPEIQKADPKADLLSSENAQRFIEFIMMQAQQAMLFLGRLPHPTNGDVTVNLEAAKMFIDYLDMLREKTRGNLSSDEEKILGNIVSDLQMSFVQVSSEQSKNISKTSQETSSSQKDLPPTESPSTPLSGEEDQKKRFSKSYGEL